MDRARSIRTAALAGIVGPVTFLAVAIGGALVRSDVIRAQGWTGWPSSMALGGLPGIPQIAAFLGLAVCYPIFALGAVRPALRDALAWGGSWVSRSATPSSPHRPTAPANPLRGTAPRTS